MAHQNPNYKNIKVGDIIFKVKEPTVDIYYITYADDDFCFSTELCDIGEPTLSLTGNENILFDYNNDEFQLNINEVISELNYQKEKANEYYDDLLKYAYMFKKRNPKIDQYEDE